VKIIFFPNSFFALYVVIFIKGNKVFRNHNSKNREIVRVAEDFYTLNHLFLGKFRQRKNTINLVSYYFIFKFTIQISLMNILIINGPNLNLLGTREPDIYGKISMEDFLKTLCKQFSQDNIYFFQSNIEGELIDRIQVDDYEALVVNFGAFTHYSYALADCLKNISKPKIEVHISNIYKREEFRHKSVTASHVDALLSGFGMEGYRLAIMYLTSKQNINEFNR